MTEHLLVPGVESAAGAALPARPVDLERRRVPAVELRWRCNPEVFAFTTTEEIPPLGEIVGQSRALRAIRMGLGIPSRGYNLFVTGVPGSGRTTAVTWLLREFAREREVPPDIAYVHNFRDPGSPHALVLPPGQGNRLRRDVDELMGYLRRLVPLVLEGKGHADRRKARLDQHRARDRELSRGFEEQVKAGGFQLVAVQEGGLPHPELVAVVDGQPVSLDELDGVAEKLSAGQADELRARHARLSELLLDVMRERGRGVREAQEDLRRIDEEAVHPVVQIAVEEIRERYAGEAVSAWLDEVRESLLSELDIFRRPAEEREEAAERDGAPAGAAAGRDPYRLYRVNVVVDNSRQQGAPVIVENHPTFTNLFGAVERPLGRSEAAPDEFASIRAGSLLRARGGYLVIDAHDLMSDPAVWPAVKRTLRSGFLEIQNAEAGYLLTPSGIKPEPVPLDLKVVLIGDLGLYQMLHIHDEDFRRIFKVRADFDHEMERSTENLRRYGGFVSKICQEESLLPFDSSAVAAVAEFGARLAEHRDKLSVQFSEVADLVRESSYWAAQSGGRRVDHDFVEQALRERLYRTGLLEEKAREMVREGLILIDTEGEAIGQVNGLTVLEFGDILFGRPVRITATTAMGRSGIINIERESDLSGKTHDKGMLILAGYLRAKYAQDKPLTVSASICFEQSYSGVDGDSASSAEAYAVLSSLAELPAAQGIAVTGSVNQRGEIQAVGGINEKVESFFDLCLARGLNGRQGVIIPEVNRSSLMLRKDLVEAVERGQFHIYAIRTVDEGLEVLTGWPAGVMLPPPAEEEEEPGPLYEPGTVNGRVDEKLRALAYELKFYSEEDEGVAEPPRRRTEDEDSPDEPPGRD